MKESKTERTPPTTACNDSSSLHELSALARRLAAQGKFGESALAIERLFAIAGPMGKRSSRLLGEARQSYSACQRRLMKENHAAAKQAAAELQVETEKLAGCPIRVTADDFDPLHGSGMELVWEHGRDPHLVLKGPDPKHTQPYELATGLLRIQLEMESRIAGKSRVPVVSAMQKSKLVSMFALEEARLQAEDGGLWSTLNRDPHDIALRPIEDLVVSVPFMLVDARLRQRFPVLRPAQFVSRSKAFLENWNEREVCTNTPPTQRLRERIITAIDGLDGLYLDWLFSGVTNFAVRYEGLDGFDLSQELWHHWEARYPEILPGGESALVDAFSEILGLSNRFEWIPGPCIRRH
jgi:hypothetical protein